MITQKAKLKALAVSDVEKSHSVASVGGVFRVVGRLNGYRNGLNQALFSKFFQAGTIELDNTAVSQANFPASISAGLSYTVEACSENVHVRTHPGKLLTSVVWLRAFLCALL